MIDAGGRTLKISNAWAGVAGVGVVALAAMVVGLALAGWKPEAVTALFVGLGALVGAVAAAVRKSEVVEAKTDAQTEQLGEMHKTMTTVERRTNGELDQRIAAAMEEAAEMGAARAIAALRKDGGVQA